MRKGIRGLFYYRRIALFMRKMCEMVQANGWGGAGGQVNGCRAMVSTGPALTYDVPRRLAGWHRGWGRGHNNLAVCNSLTHLEIYASGVLAWPTPCSVSSCS